MAEEKVYKGGCLCGAVRIELQGPPAKVFLCHCVDCQRSAGGGFQTSAIYDTDKIKIIDPDHKLKIHVIPGATLPSGYDKHRNFCADCGGPLFNQSLRFQGKKTIIKSAILDKLQSGDGSP